MQVSESTLLWQIRLCSWCVTICKWRANHASKVRPQAYYTVRTSQLRGNRVKYFMYIYTNRSTRVGMCRK